MITDEQFTKLVDATGMLAAALATLLPSTSNEPSWSCVKAALDLLREINSEKQAGGEK
jgi:hypothetical protein